jgi:uncharacterized Zn finger protein (UPF0148 family)
VIGRRCALTGLPFELFLGFGLLAVVCERCGTAVSANEGMLCPECGEQVEDVPPEDLREGDDDA